VLLFGLAPAATGAATADPAMERLILCKDSWMDWQKANAPQLGPLRDDLNAGYKPHGNDPYFLPKKEITIAGFRVIQLYPGSVGMGVGISAMIAAPFDKAKATYEKLIGKKFVHCENGEGMKTCELELGPKRTAMILAADPEKKPSTLIGCYYYYEK
jgi:hypothetical protein